jgi:hypothetical protein
MAESPAKFEARALSGRGVKVRFRRIAPVPGRMFARSTAIEFVES